MSYTELLLAAQVLRASGVRSDPARTGIVEGAARRLGSALAMLEVLPEGVIADSLSPAVLDAIGRSLVVSGESVWIIRRSGWTAHA